MAKKYFWNEPRSTFAGKKYGEEVTEYFTGDSDKRLKNLVDIGKISEKKPETVEVAKQSELHQLRKTVENQKAKIVILEDRLKQSATKPDISAALEAALEKYPKKSKEAVDRIVELEKQVEELTSPDNDEAGDGGE